MIVIITLAWGKPRMLIKLVEIILMFLSLSLDPTLGIWLMKEIYNFPNLRIYYPF
ncbi:hypothetical protein C7972_11591 [Arenibacter sp. ARW7G5Y1]|nr:hypothetical protein C7972_11591 [Arenibacter sp. ARW7G5Y1]